MCIPDVGGCSLQLSRVSQLLKRCERHFELLERFFVGRIDLVDLAQQQVEKSLSLGRVLLRQLSGKSFDFGAITPCTRFVERL